jgi:hypothetical protein
MAVAVSRSGTTTETSTLWCGAVLLGEGFQTLRSIVGALIFWVKQWKKIFFFFYRVTLKMKALKFFETSITSSLTTRRHTTEDLTRE